MRKQVTAQSGSEETKAGEQGSWFDLEQLAQVEVSSEATGCPVENALVLDGMAESARGWQAEKPGPASITLRFDVPQMIQKIFLHVAEPEHERSQEWALSATFSDGTQRELLRQGWNFSPSGSTEQRESYTFDLKQVSALTLTIDPDRGRDRYPATLLAWQIGTGR